MNPLGLDIYIDSLNDAALAYCIDLLYDELNFNNLTKEEVRKVDIKEKLNSYNSWLSDGFIARDYLVREQNKEKNTCNETIEMHTVIDYLRLIDKYLNSNLMQTQEGSRSKLYKDRVINQISNILSTYENNKTRGIATYIPDWDDTISLSIYDSSQNMYYVLCDTNDFDDIATVFICLLRQPHWWMENPTVYCLSDNNSPLILTKSDYDNIKNVFCMYKHFPDDYRKVLLGDLSKKKTKLEFLNEKRKKLIEEGPKGLIDINVNYEDDDISEILKFLYLYSTVFLCREIQKSGGFQLVDKENKNEQD